MTTYERDIGARLRMELARLGPLNPFETLRLSVDATPEQIRAAFLAATKQYHPNRFARESPDTVEAANEIFLLIRRAYSQLTDESKRQAWRTKLSRGSGPLRASKMGLEAAPLPTPLLGVPVVSGAAAGASKAAASAPTPPPGAWPRPPAAAPPTKPSSPQTGRTSAEVRAILDSARTRAQRYDQAVHLLQKRRYPEAKGILTQLMSEDPQSRRYRVKLCHAVALELEGEGKLAAAIKELERALVLDPEAHEEKEALRRLQKERGRGGIFSKIFGR